MHGIGHKNQKCVLYKRATLGGHVECQDGKVRAMTTRMRTWMGMCTNALVWCGETGEKEAP